MKRIVITFGLISAAISGVLMSAGTVMAERIGFDKAIIVGYTTMVLSLLLVYFGVRSYRDTVGGGSISFGRAFAVGLLITAISCAGYVVAWEILYFNFMPDFLDKYSAYVVEQVRASGGTEDAARTQLQQMERIKELYNNPFFNVALTLLEPLPVGIVITLLSALILKKKATSGAAV